MTKEETLKCGYDIVYLINSAISGGKPNIDKVRSMNLGEVKKLCSRHRVSAVVAYALLSDDLLFDEQKLVWQDKLNYAMLWSLTFQQQLEKILEHMRKNKIRYMLMKGLVLRELYPEPYLREMVDNDIYYDADGYRIMRKFMLENGYKTPSATKETHVDEYFMEPYYSFELHKRFFMINRDKWSRYYSDMSKFLILSGDYEYKMSDEDFYVYITLHSYKHMSDSGVGLRALLDCFLYTEKKKDTLNWEYIDKELEKLGILDFEKSFKNLSEKLFKTNEKLSFEEEKDFLFIISSGAFGTAQQTIGKSIESLGKSSYLRRRLFPTLEWYKGNAPFVYRHKWIIPFYVVYRIIFKGISGRKRIKKEIDIVNKTK